MSLRIPMIGYQLHQVEFGTKQILEGTIRKSGKILRARDFYIQVMAYCLLLQIITLPLIRLEIINFLMKEYIIHGSRIKTINDFLKLAENVFSYTFLEDSDLEDFAVFAKANLEVPSIIIWKDSGDSHRALGYDYGKIIDSFPFHIAKSRSGEIIAEKSIFVSLR